MGNRLEGRSIPHQLASVMVGRLRAGVGSLRTAVLAASLATLCALGDETNLTTLKFSGDFIDTVPSVGVFLDRHDMVKILFEDKQPFYDKADPPNWGKGPVEVKAGVRITRITSIDERDNSFSVDLYYRLQWVDDRLMFGSKLGDLKVFTLAEDDERAARLWRPDVAFVNLLDATPRGTSTHLSQEGEVLWLRHMHVKFATRYDLGWFPFDTQTLPIHLESFKVSRTFQDLDWAQTLPLYLNAAVRHNQFNIQGMNLERVQTYYNSSSVWFTSLSTSMLITRRVSSFFWKMIIPIYIIVLTGTLTYWIPPTAVPARVVLSITCILTQVAFQTSVTAMLPRISYVTWMDCYCFVAMCFNTFALFEFKVVLGSGVREKQELEAGSNGEKLEKLCRTWIAITFTIFTVVMLLVGFSNIWHAPPPHFPFEETHGLSGGEDTH